MQFITNAINTRTQGFEIILNENWKIKNANLIAMLAANFTQTRLFGEIKAAGNLKADSLNTNTLLNIEERTKTEKILFCEYGYKMVKSAEEIYRVNRK